LGFADNFAGVNFIIAHNSLALINKDNPDYNFLINNLLLIHKALDELIEDITLFMKYDHNEEQKIIVSIQHPAKITARSKHPFLTPENKASLRDAAYSPIRAT
jgi:hypothetical protein